jgi:uncharacterized membrane-anchored protein
MKRWGIILSALLVLGVLNYAIYQKEQILKSGDIVLLQLVPADPRSLMQGDYMHLAFAIEREARKVPIHETRGYLVIEVGENKQGTFKRIYQKEPLKENEKLIHFNYDRLAKFRPSRPLEITPSSFLFQEGQARYYQQAKFAIFHYNGNKDYVLVGLADEKGNKIEPPKTSLLENRLKH